MSASLRIAVVGSGIAGLSAAALFTNSGHDVSVFEAFETPSPVGAGLLLQPTGLSVLSKLGLDEEIISKGNRINKLYGREKSKSNPTLDVKYSDYNARLFGVGCHRGILFSVLYHHVQSLGVRVFTDSQVVKVCGDCIQIDTSEQFGPFDLIVDASGVNSLLRAKYANIDVDIPYQFGALWATVDLPEKGFQLDRLEQRYDTASKMAGILPVGIHQGCQRAVFFWSIKAEQFEKWQLADLEKWKQEVTDVWPEIASTLSQLNNHDNLTFAIYRHTKLRQYHAGNIVFIGDSAHCMSPQLGQGANLALVDSLMLSTNTDNSISINQGLEEFGRMRRNHIDFYQYASRWLTPFFQSDSWFYSKFRYLVCDLMCHVPPARYVAGQVLSGVKTGVFSSLNPGEWDAKYDVRRKN